MDNKDKKWESPIVYDLFDLFLKAQRKKQIEQNKEQSETEIDELIRIEMDKENK